MGVGACGQDAMDVDELKYVYHENGQQFIQVWLRLSSYVNQVMVDRLSF